MSNEKRMTEMDLLEAEADLDLSDFERMRLRTLNTLARCDRIEARLDRIETVIGLGNPVDRDGARRTCN
jgi:hypothetical protein